LKSVCKNVRRAPGSRDWAVKGTVNLILIRGCLESKTPDTTCLHAPATTTALQTSAATQGWFLLQRVTARQRDCSIANDIAGYRSGIRVGSPHVTDGAGTIYDRTPALAGLPLFSEPPIGTRGNGCGEDCVAIRLGYMRVREGIGQCFGIDNCPLILLLWWEIAAHTISAIEANAGGSSSEGGLRGRHDESGPGPMHGCGRRPG